MKISGQKLNVVKPLGNYVPAKIVGNLLYTSG